MNSVHLRNVSANLPIISSRSATIVRKEYLPFDKTDFCFAGSVKTEEATLPVPRRKRVTSRMKIFTGRAHPKLAAEIAEYLGTKLSPAKITSFSNGETYVRIDESVRGFDCYVVQPTSYPANDNIIELLFMVDALKRAGAKSIKAVIPHYGYARGDRRADRREAITAKVIADLLEKVGVKHVITMDLHANQLEGFFDTSVDNLQATPLTLGYLMKKHLQDIVIVSPDAGGVKRASVFAEKLGVEYAHIEKKRKEHNKSESVKLIGNVEGKIAIIVDDMIDTAGSIKGAAELLMKSGAKKVLALATHGVLSGAALENLKNAPIDEVIVTNTIPLTPEAEKLDKLSQITIAPIIGEAIGRILDDQSVSEIADLRHDDHVNCETHPDEKPQHEQKNIISRILTAISSLFTRISEWFKGLFAENTKQE